MGKYQSAKYTSCFRQFGAEGTHCRFIHAYKIRFECEFNKDIKYLKVNYPEFIDYLDRWFEDNFNYKTFVAKNDPKLNMFEYLDTQDVIDLITLPYVGCERFSEFVLDNINNFIKMFDIDIECIMVETWEHEKNSGIAFIEM
jgi:6-pyruvoyltetrahydropterin/6-carboxytetrahydropterin synthase